MSTEQQPPRSWMERHAAILLPLGMLLFLVVVVALERCL